MTISNKIVVIGHSGRFMDIDRIVVPLPPPSKFFKKVTFSARLIKRR